jgi:hypothetical protein
MMTTFSPCKDSIKTDTINLIWWKLQPDSVYEYDWLNLLLSDFNINHIIDFESQACVENAIIVANLSQSFFAGSGARELYHKELQEFYDYIKCFQTAGTKVGLVHLGDEFYRESTSFYQDLDFVFRQYYKEEDHQKYPHCYSGSTHSDKKLLMVFRGTSQRNPI